MPTGSSHNDLAKGKSVGDRIHIMRSVNWTATAGFGRNPIQAGGSLIDDLRMGRIVSGSDFNRYNPPPGIGGLEFLKGLLFMLFAGIGDGKSPTAEWAKQLQRPGALAQLDSEVRTSGFRNFRDWAKYAERTLDWWVKNSGRPISNSDRFLISEAKSIFRLFKNA